MFALRPLSDLEHRDLARRVVLILAYYTATLSVSLDFALPARKQRRVYRILDTRLDLSVNSELWARDTTIANENRMSLAACHHLALVQRHNKGSGRAYLGGEITSVSGTREAESLHTCVLDPRRPSSLWKTFLELLAVKCPTGESSPAPI